MAAVTPTACARPSRLKPAGRQCIPSGCRVAAPPPWSAGATGVGPTSGSSHRRERQSSRSATAMGWSGKADRGTSRFGGVGKSGKGTSGAIRASAVRVEGVTLPKSPTHGRDNGSCASPSCEQRAPCAPVQCCCSDAIKAIAARDSQRTVWMEGLAHALGRSSARRVLPEGVVALPRQGVRTLSPDTVPQGGMLQLAHLSYRRTLMTSGWHKVKLALDSRPLLLASAVTPPAPGAVSGPYARTICCRRVCSV